MHEPRAQEPLTQAPYFKWPSPDGSAWANFYRFESGYLLRFDDIADFYLPKCEIRVDCYPSLEATDEASRRLCRNQVDLLARSRQDQLVFHASAVELGQFAVGFVGESGSGKSTLAANFAIHGQRFLSEDGLILESNLSATAYEVLPHDPAIRLWHDSWTALTGHENGHRPASLATHDALYFSAGVDMTGTASVIAFADQPRPLKCLYLLGVSESTSVSIRPVAKTEAVFELLKSSFLLDIDEPQATVAHFKRISMLVGQIPVYRLDYARRFELLDEVHERVLQHATTPALLLG